MIGWGTKMTKFLAGVGLIILSAGLSFGRKPLVMSQVTEFQEPELVMAGELKYPVNSVDKLSGISRFEVDTASSPQPASYGWGVKRSK